jgi:DEAD/DEAH box helicase domain-containing protein
MLHLGILQYHQNHWASFFKNLKTVAIDECHEYRGIFGTNVSYILRRLRQVCKFHGSNPTFIATSATVEDPQAHLRELVGADFRLIDTDQDGSKQGRRKFYVLSGTENYLEFSRRLAKSLVDAGLRVLAFCPSRITAERMLAKMRKPNGELESHVAVYRSGLTAEEREKIEGELRNGSKSLVFSTSALELGIDIGRVDHVIQFGSPREVARLIQRVGRAGHQLEAVSRGEITRAKRLLQKLDPEAVGLFVNRIPVFQGAGYLEPLIVETLTRTRFETFMSRPKWSLAWDVARIRMARRLA